MFPKIGVINVITPKWIVKIRENPIRIDDLVVPLFLETPISSLHSKTGESFAQGLSISFFGFGRKS